MNTKQKSMSVHGARPRETVYNVVSGVQVNLIVVPWVSAGGDSQTRGHRSL